MKLIKEVCIGSIEDVKMLLSKKDEFDRFETCFDLTQGGLTPTLEIYKYIEENFTQEQVVMIRPKNKFEIDSNQELEEIKNDLKKFINLGAKNFIFGYITKDKKIDVESCKELIKILREYHDVTWSFHMAIDLVGNYNEALQTLIELKFTRVLTKGGNDSAINNVEQLREIREKFSNKIEILVGGKVTKDNYLEIQKKTGLSQFHGTKIV